MVKRLIVTLALTGTLIGTSALATHANGPTDEPVVNTAIQDDLDAKVAQTALEAYKRAISEQKSDSKIFTIIDYTLPSTKKRMWVFDLKNQQLLFHNLVSHARESGNKYATQFSNKIGSHKTSLGLYQVKNKYMGGKGVAVRMQGLEKGINDNAMPRAIVVHGAKYANPEFINQTGRLGRSFGCPAVPVALIKPIVETIKDGSYMYLYGKDKTLLTQSKYLSAKQA